MRFFVSQEYKQIKSYTYYLFWGAATIAVVVGQMQISKGLYALSESIERSAWQLRPEPRFSPVPMPPEPEPYIEPIYIEPYPDISNY